MLNHIPNCFLCLQRHSLPLFLSPTFDLRAHLESLGHGVSNCTDLRLTSRRCAGFLTKRGGRVKTWKKRWFLFDMDHRRLAYYTGENTWCNDVLIYSHNSFVSNTFENQIKLVNLCVITLFSNGNIL